MTIPEVLLAPDGGVILNIPIGDAHVTLPMSESDAVALALDLIRESKGRGGPATAPAPTDQLARIDTDPEEPPVGAKARSWPSGDIWTRVAAGWTMPGRNNCETWAFVLRYGPLTEVLP